MTARHLKVSATCRASAPCGRSPRTRTKHSRTARTNELHARTSTLRPGWCSSAPRRSNALSRAGSRTDPDCLSRAPCRHCAQWGRAHTIWQTSPTHSVAVDGWADSIATATASTDEPRRISQRGVKLGATSLMATCSTISVASGRAVVSLISRRSRSPRTSTANHGRIELARSDAQQGMTYVFMQSSSRQGGVYVVDATKRGHESNAH